MSDSLLLSVSTVKAAMTACGIEAEILELPSSTHTAADAASSLNCSVAQIAKSIIFETVGTQKPILVIARGEKRVDEKLVSASLGEKIKKASAEFVKEKTGFVIGGVSPFGSISPLTVFFDVGLLDFDFVWIAAGTQNAVCSISPQTLLDATGARQLTL